MTHDPPHTDQSPQLLLLELALAVGRMQTMDLDARCQEFLRVLLTRKNMSYGAIWLRANLHNAQATTYELAAAFPEAGIDQRIIDTEHPVIRRLGESAYFITRHGDPDFETLTLERGAKSGAIATLRLGDIGLLRLYWNGGEHFSVREANQLMSVLEIFAISLEGALAAKELSRQFEIREKLVAEKEEAILANETKSNFLAKMSHELRTPLNAILGFSEVISKQVFGPPGSAKYTEYANHIHNSAGLLLSLVDDLLDITSIENEEMEMNRMTIHPGELMDECARLVEAAAQAKDIELLLIRPELEHTMFADRKHITQILVNLLTNATKFTNEGGRITFTGTVGDSASVFEISDNGIGIAPEKLRDITAPFVQIQNEAYHAEKGWGLGLSIAKSLVQMHNGRMDIESEPNEGTTVWITIPNFDTIGDSHEPAGNAA